jgi:hypothetical protein
MNDKNKKISLLWDGKYNSTKSEEGRFWMDWGVKHIISYTGKNTFHAQEFTLHVKQK